VSNALLKDSSEAIGSFGLLFVSQKSSVFDVKNIKGS
jgi:hypothetical protein